MLRNGNQKGLALIPVLMVVAVLFISTALLGLIAVHKAQNVVGEERMLQAFYAAEAGLETTKATILHNPAWYNNLPDMGKDVFTVIFPSPGVTEGIIYEVAVNKVKQAIGSQLTIRSVGACTAAGKEALASKTLQATIGIFNVQDYFKGLTILHREPGTLVLSGAMEINATLIADGNVSLDQNKVVNGDIYAGNGISGYSTGGQFKNYQYIPPCPQLNPIYYLDKASAHGHVWETGATFGGPATPGEDGGAIPVYGYSGFYFVDGDINIAGYYQGQALLFSTGDIHVQGDLVPGGGDDLDPDVSLGSLTLVALGDVEIQQHRVYANVLAQGNLRAWPGATFYGAACISGVVVDGESAEGALSLYYEDVLVPMEGTLEMPLIKTVTWGERYQVF